MGRIAGWGTYQHYMTPEHARRAGRRHARAGKPPVKVCAWPGSYMGGYRDARAEKSTAMTGAATETENRTMNTTRRYAGITWTRYNGSWWSTNAQTGKRGVYVGPTWAHVRQYVAALRRTDGRFVIT